MIMAQDRDNQVKKKVGKLISNKLNVEE